jgi:2-polyprenyl-6-methoxyphenol hydroxylase-like FAD-dependent oxidoreductase
MSTALIIGGGIGGLTAALALRRRGFDAQVYEAAPALRPVGKGIWVPTNAMQVLDRLGVAAAVRRAGWPLDRIQLRTADGRLLTDVDLRPVAAKYGHTTVSVHRAELVRVLADALPPDALHLGKRGAGAEADGGGVTVRFADGTQARGDVLVAADGIHSAVRDQFFPKVALRYSGVTCYRGVADLDLPADLARTCWEVWGGAARIGFSAVGPGQVYWFAPVTAPAGSPLPAGADLAAELAGRYAAFPDPVPAIVRRTPPAEVIRTDLYDFAPIRRWWRGRVVLLGDAAHAMTPNLGQGGAQAIEDAYVLADRLAAGPTPERAFAEYERLRRPKARWVVNTAWRIGRLAHVRGRWLQGLRNAAMRWTPDWVNARQIDHLYALNY